MSEAIAQRPTAVTGPDDGYVLITPARNEEAFIARTIESVLAQTVLPRKWVIVNDGSSDRTAEIVESYARTCGFMRLVKLDRSGERNFGSKALAFAHGYSMVADVQHVFVGNLDADICVPVDYYEGIMRRLNEDARLGIVGGIVYTKVGERFLTADENPQSVGGAVQFFRRECLAAIGSYRPLPYGGIDAAAEIEARRLGWKVRKFPEYRVIEHRRTGSAEATPLRACLREGRRFHALGYGLVFYLLRSLYKMRKPPMVIGGLASFIGFLGCWLKRDPVHLPKDTVSFLRSEQRQRLLGLLLGRSVQADTATSSKAGRCPTHPAQVHTGKRNERHEQSVDLS